MNFELLHNALSRRTFLRDATLGLGSVALSSLLNPPSSFGTVGDLNPYGGVLLKPHHPPKAKRVIFLCMAGGPSHLETFDYKPKLAQMNGEPMPESFTKGQPIAQLQGQELKCLGPQFPFERFGESGQQISTLFPHIGSVADDICILRSMQTEQINHDPAHTFMNTGTAISGRPSMGSWITYGLGSEGSNLPGFVVLTSQGGRNPQPIAARQWHSGFLPSQYQGVELRAQGDPVLYVGNPPGVGRENQRRVVGAVNQLNALHHETAEDPEILTRIQQFEMAFRMQASVPELVDLSDEPQEVLDLYGCTPGDGSFASNCLLARRLAERGVRFIHLYHRGWDHHGDLDRYMRICSKLVDQATAALIKDLKRRGMLDETLIVWGGEFGRTPMFQGKGATAGRDHHIRAFSMFLAGGGVRGGMTYGETDDLGYYAVHNKVHVHDLHATMLHLLGVNHERLTYRFQGRDFRLTDVHGNVVHDILA